MTGEETPVPARVAFDNLDGRIRVFRAGHEIDTAAVVTERYVVVVDTMATPALAAGVMEAMSDALVGRQLLVVNTHADWDHCWGNALFATPGGRYPAPIIGHELARERLLSVESQEHLRERQRDEPRFADVRLVAPTITFTAGLRIDGGDLTLQLIPTPGHTEDHISVWIPELRLVLAGDATERPIPYVNDPSALPTLRASLAALAGLDPAVVIPCHGGTIDPALLARNRDYFDAVERRVRAALTEGRLPPDWALRDDLPQLIGLPFEQVVPEDERGPRPVEEFYRSSHLRAVRAMVTLLA